MATCTLTLTTDRAAISNAVVFQALANQVIAGVFIDTTPIIATASGTSYTATLQQKAKYLVKAARFPFDNFIIVIPASSSADASTLLTDVRSG